MNYRLSMFCEIIIYGPFLILHIFLHEKNYINFKKKYLPMYRWCNYILLFVSASSSQWTLSDACRLKTALGVGFSVTKNVSSQERGGQGTGEGGGITNNGVGPTEPKFSHVLLHPPYPIPFRRLPAAPLVCHFLNIRVPFLLFVPEKKITWKM